MTTTSAPARQCPEVHPSMLLQTLPGLEHADRWEKLPCTRPLYIRIPMPSLVSAVFGGTGSIVPELLSSVWTGKVSYEVIVSSVAGDSYYGPLGDWDKGVLTFKGKATLKELATELRRAGLNLPIVRFDQGCLGHDLGGEVVKTRTEKLNFALDRWVDAGEAAGWYPYSVWVSLIPGIAGTCMFSTDTPRTILVTE